LTRNIFCGEIPLADTIFNGVRVCKHRNNIKVHLMHDWHLPVTSTLTLKSYWHSSKDVWDMSNKSNVFQNVFKFASFSHLDSGLVTFDCSHDVTFKWLMNNELQKMWKEAAVAQFKVVSWYCVIRVSTVLLMTSCWLVIS
jgi:hypothetical protein